MDYAAAVSVRISQIPPEPDADVTHKIRQRYKQAGLRLQPRWLFLKSAHPATPLKKDRRVCFLTPHPGHHTELIKKYMETRYCYAQRADQHVQIGVRHRNWPLGRINVRIPHPILSHATGSWLALFSVAALLHASTLLCFGRFASLRTGPYYDKGADDLWLL